MKCVKGRTFLEVMRKKHELEVYSNYVQCELKPHWTDCCFGQATLSWFVSALSKEIIRSPTERWLLKKGLMYQSIPKPPIPPGQSPGIWLVLSSVQWEIWLKTRPVRWGIWLSCQNVCQRSEAKDFAIIWFSRWAAFTGHCCCRFHVGFSVVVILYSSIVEYAFV